MQFTNISGHENFTELVLVNDVILSGLAGMENKMKAGKE